MRERRVKIKYCELHRCNSLDPKPPLYMDAISFSLLWFMQSNTCQKLLTLWFHFSANSSTWSWSSLNIKLILYFKQLKKIIFNKTKSIISLQKTKTKKVTLFFCVVHSTNWWTIYNLLLSILSHWNSPSQNLESQD